MYTQSQTHAHTATQTTTQTAADCVLTRKGFDTLWCLRHTLQHKLQDTLQHTLQHTLQQIVFSLEKDLTRSGVGDKKMPVGASRARACMQERKRIR